MDGAGAHVITEALTRYIMLFLTQYDQLKPSLILAPLRVGTNHFEPRTDYF